MISKHTIKKEFLNSIRGNKLKYKRYTGAPIRYAGGKSLAVGFLLEHIPTNVEKIVSPFIGGGSIEMAIANEIGIPVIGYDIFDVLVNFWQEFLNHKNRLVKNLKNLTPTKELYKEIKDDLKKYWKNQKRMSKEELAWKYYFNHNLSYGPGFLGWMSSNYLDKRKYDSMINKLSLKKNDNMKVKKGSFENVVPKHNKDFLYLDPPYFISGQSTLFKGIYPMRNIPIHHNGFKHELLAKQLKKHKGGFILSYNDCPEIRKLYKGFKIMSIKWQYTMGQGEKRIGKNRKENGFSHIKESSEIFIIGKRK